MYMKLPNGFAVNSCNSNNYVLHLQTYLYGQKQAGRVWNKHLIGKITSSRFVQSQADECIMTQCNVIVILYTNISLLAAPMDAELDQATKNTHECGLYITKHGDVKDFLGVKINCKQYSSFKLTLPHLIDQVLKNL
jgi:Reverse transcriptase (RNA-dependent DNA polymerase)